MKVLFLSDLHLGADYIADPAAHERTVVDFLRREGRDADSIYLLGDVLDYWYEYRHVVPKGFVRFFGALADLVDRGVKVTWMTGNHDIWLFGYLDSELGIEVVDAPFVRRQIGDKKFILAHGDRVGRPSPGFRFISRLFRNRTCQRLYSMIHPGLTIPFAKRWSRSSRAGGKSYDASSPHSIRRIKEDARSVVAQYPDTDFFVEGHHHLVLDTRLDATHTRLIVLGDWIDKFTYAVYDGANIGVHKFVK